MFIPALMLGYALDLFGSTYLQAAGLYDHGHYAMRMHIMPNHIPIEQLDLSVFIANLFMFQSFFVEPLGSNTPLWSLSYEFWFYIFFGIAMIAVSSYR